jgi:hypothetical protein
MPIRVVSAVTPGKGSSSTSGLSEAGDCGRRSTGLHQRRSGDWCCPISLRGYYSGGMGGSGRKDWQVFGARDAGVSLAGSASFRRVLTQRSDRRGGGLMQTK